MKPMKISGKVLQKMAEHFAQGYYIEINRKEKMVKPDYHCIKLAQSSDIRTGKSLRAIWAVRRRECETDQQG
jgi:hypothetical protein